MALDGAGRHQRQALTLAIILRLLKLPPYSPELSPVEHLQDDLREKSCHNRIFDSIDVLEIHLESSLRAMELDHPRVRSIVVWPRIIHSLKNEKWNEPGCAMLGSRNRKPKCEGGARLQMCKCKT